MRKFIKLQKQSTNLYKCFKEVFKALHLSEDWVFCERKKYFLPVLNLLFSLWKGQEIQVLTFEEIIVHISIYYYQFYWHLGWEYTSQ